MLASLCSPERELSCRFSGMGCPVWETRALARRREGRVAAAIREKRGKGGSGGWMQRTDGLRACTGIPVTRLFWRGLEQFQ